MTKDKIEEFLGIEVMDEEDIKGELVERNPTLPSNSIDDEKDLEDDVEFARANLYELLSNGNEALEDLLRLAKQSESARAYEVVSELMSVVFNGNKDLIELNKKRADVKAKIDTNKRNSSTRSGGGGVTNQNLFITTTELQRLINKASEEEKEE